MSASERRTPSSAVRAEPAGIGTAGAHDTLSAEVRLLGSLLGQVVSEQAGGDLFELVERVRRRAIALRQDDDPEERRRLDEWMAAVTLQTIEGYRELLTRSGFALVEAEDLSAEWIAILRERLRMYRGMREQTVARFGQGRYDEYNQLYAFFVGLVEAGKLGGARFSATADRALS